MRHETLTVQNLLDHFDFEVLYKGNTNLEIVVSEIDRPGLELAGYFDYTHSNQILLLGLKEMHYLETLDEKVQKERLDNLVQDSTPCVLIARNLDCPKYLIEACKKSNISLFRSKDQSLYLMDKLWAYISERIAPQELYHGTLMEIFGMGVLITGKSGIGKSETALELIKKGHRLIADDSVIVYEVYDHIYGKSPEHLKNLLEVRGIGVIDISKVFGITSVENSRRIDYIVELVSMDEVLKSISRLPEERYTKKIFDKEIETVSIPVAPGRAVAELVEIAITNLRLKSEGFDATKNLIDSYDEMTKKGGKK